MGELSQILGAIDGYPDTSWALATVVGVSGSTYRLPGAKQLLRADGTSVGTVSGGCLDADLVRIVGEVIESDAARFVTYDLSADDDEVWGFGLGCNGVTELLVEPASTGAHLIRELAAAHRAAGALAVVTAITGDTGARIFVRGDGGTEGSLGAPDVEQGAAEAAQAALRDGRHLQTTLSDGRRVFIEVQVPAPHLVICGAGHDAVPMVRYGAELGWQVTVFDDRRGYLTRDRFPEAAARTFGRPEELADLVELTDRTDVVVMTHNYQRDADYLRQLIPSPAGYIGMLGPRARTDRIIADLHREGVEITEAAVGRLYAPAGLDIGAEGPDQIAWAILAEVQAVRHGRTGGHLRNRRGGIHQGLEEQGET